MKRLIGKSAPAGREQKEGAGQPAVNAARRKALKDTTTLVFLSVGVAALGTLAPKPAHAGWGCCYKCYCREFVPAPGDSDHCSNCGHQYSDHGSNTACRS